MKSIQLKYNKFNKLLHYYSKVIPEIDIRHSWDFWAKFIIDLETRRSIKCKLCSNSRKSTSHVVQKLLFRQKVYYKLCSNALDPNIMHFSSYFPSAGFMIDATENYWLTFITMGVFSMVAGMCIAIQPWVARVADIQFNVTWCIFYII